MKLLSDLFYLFPILYLAIRWPKRLYRFIWKEKAPQLDDVSAAFIKQPFEITKWILPILDNSWMLMGIAFSDLRIFFVVIVAISLVQVLTIIAMAVSAVVRMHTNGDISINELIDVITNKEQRDNFRYGVQYGMALSSSLVKYFKSPVFVCALYFQ